MRLVIVFRVPAVFGLVIKLLQILKSYTDIETHLVMNRRCYKKFCIGNYAGYC